MTGGQGPLAEVIAARSGKAAPEAPFVIEHREELIYMLCEAAEIEHGIMCQYLFAAFSLKQSRDEGLTEPELAAVHRWRSTILRVAAQEMLHLALVHNLLSAVGAAPHLTRPNFPAPAGHFPAGVHLTLLPFGEQALRHFLFLERPEGMELADADGLAAAGPAIPVLSERDIVPRGQEFATIGHLYRSIAAGIDRLAAKHGPDWLFVGPPQAQATQAAFGWAELVAVTGPASARKALHTIVEQGEGPTGNWRDAHFGQFVAILEEHRRLRAANPGFQPARPVLSANVRPHERIPELPIITDRLTARVADLFNVGYEILLQLLERYFAHTGETTADLRALTDAAVAVMTRVIRPLGDLITTLPVGPEHPGRTAGPSFELFYQAGYLMPHREAAWALLAERLDEAVWLCAEIQASRGAAIAAQLDPVVTALRQVTATLAVRLPTGSPHARLATQPARLDPAALASSKARADSILNVTGVPASAPAATQRLAGLLHQAHALVSDACQPGTDKDAQALLLPRLIDSVLRPLAGAVTATGPAVPAPPSADPRQEGPPDEPGGAPGGAVPAIGARVWDVAKDATRLRARLAAQDGGPPAGLTEACAALQDMALELTEPPERAQRLAELRDLLAGLPVTVQAARNGPYLVTNLPRLITPLGVDTTPAPQLALCRCGKSARKPLCDGSHAVSGFDDAKDPGRVPDRRDTYHGQQVTVFDNRGICQHSGYCTDRLPAVFRTDVEPFVAPSGGRMDEIIRAVRDCPSGALSYALGEAEARAHVDWDNARDPAIEVTRDGPYRVSGGIPVLDGDGSPAARAQGSSAEHCALCRCGYSRNKPFCSGMHWYAEFRDPVPAPGHAPTPFEWAGGLSVLIRMTRRLYEKHIPADPLLAPLHATMPADQPYRLAAWLAEALGGPPLYTQRHVAGEAADSGATSTSPGFTAPERARWTRLLTQAADEAGLPADSRFRSVFNSCATWAASQAWDASPAARGPRWGWGPAGPPPEAAAPGPAVPDASQAPAPAAEPGAERRSATGPAQPPPAGALSYAADIQPLFRQHDRQSMSFKFDLWSHADVAAHADDILRRLQAGTMPCDGPWPPEKVETFKRWTETGKRA
jgi:CDGSH-type Zn-finger protein/truncated hemoglobin YjbI